MIQLTCAKFETRFHDLLDQRSDPSQDAQLFSHSQHCKPCQQMMRAHASIESVLDSISAQPASRLEHKPVVSISRWSAVAAAIVLTVAVTSHFVVSARSNTAKAESGDANINMHVAENEVRSSAADESGNHLLALASNFNLLIPDDLSTQAEWIEPVTTPMRPLQESVSSTINVLRRTIPGYRKTVDADGKTSYRITLQNEWA